MRRWLFRLVLIAIIGAAAVVAGGPELAPQEPVLPCSFFGCGNEVPLHCVSWEQDGIMWTCWEGWQEGGPDPF